MTENIIESTIDEAKKRLSESPFWSSFIISWLVMNWKILYISTSLNSTSINEKIDAIAKLYPTWFETIGSLVIYPLIASFITVALVPFINHFYLWIRKEFRDWDASIEIKEIQKEKEVIQEKMDLKKEEQELKYSEQEQWDKEYNEIYKTGIIPILVRFIFEENWQNYYQNGENYLDTYSLATAVKYDLISESWEREYILTNKGKYIIKKYPSEDLKKSLTNF